MEYEHTPRQMAEKLMEFNRDFSDNEDDVKSETEYLIKLFDELQNSEQFRIPIDSETSGNGLWCYDAFFGKS